jgi:uncharacterized protein YkwD
MKRLLASLAVLLIIALTVPDYPVNAAPRAQEGGTIGEPLSILDAHAPINLLLYSGCERVDVAAINATYEQSVVELVNQHRLEHNLPPLKRVENLDYAARYHAADMAQDNYFEHASYDGWGGTTFACGTWDRIHKFVPSFNAGGENIAAGYSTPEDVMQGWLDSPGHHSNIVGAQFSELGVGYYNGSGSDYYHYWVQDFDSRWGVYPLVINREAASTTSQQVSLYIYGEGTWNEMRLRNNDGSWTNWQAFQKSVTWNLPCTSGNHTVSVELRNTGQTTAGASSSDSIILDNTSGPVTLGNVPTALTFLYCRTSGQFNIPSYTIHPLNAASSQIASWTVTKSGFAQDWLALSTTSGVTPNGSFTATPHDAGGILNTVGSYPGSLTITAASTDPQCPDSDSAIIPINLVVVNKMERVFLPVLNR